ncbi:hypothetical protein AEM42_04475 [Betaproteobacteria bacterium UKL13-2]|nr:hypothetical protein AEM42_04475 [Betaproteobacteria bacterium UKL13-2]
MRSKRGINTLRKKKLSNKTAAQRCVWRFYTVTLKNSLNRRFLSIEHEKSDGEEEVEFQIKWERE